nr:uncharacterized protein LOC106678198 isoform X2 [Halyomorpha halys]
MQITDAVPSARTNQHTGPVTDSVSIATHSASIPPLFSHIGDKFAQLVPSYQNIYINPSYGQDDEGKLFQSCSNYSYAEVLSKMAAAKAYGDLLPDVIDSRHNVHLFHEINRPKASLFCERTEIREKRNPDGSLKLYDKGLKSQLKSLDESMGKKRYWGEILVTKFDMMPQFENREMYNIDNGAADREDSKSRIVDWTLKQEYEGSKNVENKIHNGNDEPASLK